MPVKNNLKKGVFDSSIFLYILVYVFIVMYILLNSIYVLYVLMVFVVLEFSIYIV